MLRGLFARRTGMAEPDPGETGRVKALAAALLPKEFELTVSEIVCLDPACPGTETVILVMAPGAKTQAAKVPKSAAEISEPDLRAALASGGFEVLP